MSIAESRFGRLTQHFFAGFLENDLLISSGSGIQNLLTNVTGMLAAPGLLYCMLCSLKYGGWREAIRESLAWDDRLLFIHCTVVVIGFVAVVQWDALFPDRRDYQILTPLPLPARLIFLSKLCSILLLLMIFWAAGNLGVSVLFPLVSLKSGGLAILAVHAGAQLASTLAAGAFVFLVLASVQGLLLNLLSPKWFRRASVYAQLVAMLLLVFSFLATPVLIGGAAASIRGNPGWTYYCPSFWFLGLHQVLIGRGGPVFNSWCALALKGLGSAAAVAVVTYAASYRRHMQRSLDSLDVEHSEPGIVARACERVLNFAVLRHPLERAEFHFIRVTLLRSRVHRLLLTGFFGVGFVLAVGAISLLGVRSHGGPSPGLLAVQPTLLLLVLAAIRFIFGVPAELRANWLFQAADPAAKHFCLAGVRKAMLALGAFPILVALLPLHWYFCGGAAAGQLLLFGAALSALVAELLMLGFDKLPFTCSYRPGKANDKVLWALSLSVLFFGQAYQLATLARALLDRPLRMVAFLGATAISVAALRRFARRRRGAEFRFDFEDLADPAVRTLDIAHGSAVPDRDRKVLAPAPLNR